MFCRTSAAHCNTDYCRTVYPMGGAQIILSELIPWMFQRLPFKFSLEDLTSDGDDGPLGMDANKNIAKFIVSFWCSTRSPTRYLWGGWSSSPDRSQFCLPKKAAKLLGK